MFLLIQATALPTQLFHTLINKWTFQDDPSGSTQVTFQVEFAFRSAMYSQVASIFMDEVVCRMVSAFERRCKEIQPQQQSPPHPNSGFPGSGSSSPQRVIATTDGLPRTNNSDPEAADSTPSGALYLSSRGGAVRDTSALPLLSEQSCGGQHHHPLLFSVKHQQQLLLQQQSMNQSVRGFNLIPVAVRINPRSAVSGSAAASDNSSIIELDPAADAITATSATQSILPTASPRGAIHSSALAPVHAARNTNKANGFFSTSSTQSISLPQTSASILATNATDDASVITPPRTDTTERSAVPVKRVFVPVVLGGLMRGSHPGPLLSKPVVLVGKDERPSRPASGASSSAALHVKQSAVRRSAAVAGSLKEPAAGNLLSSPSRLRGGTAATRTGGTSLFSGLPGDDLVNSVKLW